MGMLDTIFDKMYPKKEANPLFDRKVYKLH